MEVAVVQFPGSNCDRDALEAFRTVLGVPARMVFHRERSLGGAAAVVLPGGFSYGDYLRCGAIARFSPVMAAVRDFADRGGPVFGICNGFQILCEAGLLPGALIRNAGLEFRCLTVALAVEDAGPDFNPAVVGAPVLRLPIAHGEGNYRLDDGGRARLEAGRQVLVRYAAGDGRVDPGSNPNGSLAGIAGIRNAAGNVWGMMPHPERAVEEIHPSTDGRAVLRAFLRLAERRAGVAVPAA